MFNRIFLLILILCSALLPAAYAPVPPAPPNLPPQALPNLPPQALPNLPPQALASLPVASSESPPVSAYSSEVAAHWFKLLAQLARSAPGYTPPVAARTFGYAGITLYEALVPGMPGYKSLADQLPGMMPVPVPPEGAQLYWPAVANGALAEISRLLMPRVTALPVRDINRLEQRLAAEMVMGEMAGRPPGLPPLEGAPVRRSIQVAPLDAAVRDAVLAQSAAHGRSVARAIYGWSLTDGGHEGYLRNIDTRFAIPAGEGMWEPTPPDYMLPLQPEWGSMRTFALASGSDCAPPAPPAFSTDPDSEFYQQAREVYDTVRTLSDEKREIALFWGDDVGISPTPPGHALSIATQVLELEHASLAFAAELYARLGMALSDSFVACWHTKYLYNVVRPITYIQRYIDPNWNNPEPTDPLLTPPFPEYTSGHSVQVRAASEILTAAFGDNYRFTDITHVERGYAPRTWSSFHAAAAEAAISRLYGGIHYRSAIEEGLAQGACIGRRVLALQFRAP